MPSSSIDEVLRAAVADGRVPGLVAEVVNSDNRVYRSAAGNKTAEPLRPMRPDAVFRIASMTKLVTSVALMMLVEERGLDLDAPLSRYVPGFRQPGVLVSFDESTREFATRPAAREATIRELLSHTGGYGYWFLHRPLLLTSGDPPNLTSPPFLMYEPGERFAYSSSTDVAGQLIEPLTGMPLDEFFDRRIFEPLGMPDTGFGLPRDSSRLVPVHAHRPEGFVVRDNETTGPPATGGGGLYSTVGDYCRLLRCLMRGGELGGRLLSADSVAEISRNQIGNLDAIPPTTALPARSNDFIFMDGTQKFGLGVMIETRDRPAGRPSGSFGWGGVINTYFWVDSRADIAAAIFMQVTPFADPLCVEILGRFEAAVYAELGFR